MKSRGLLIVASMLALAWPAGAQTQAVRQSLPPGVPVDAANPKLQLTSEQRTRIREVLAHENTDVSFARKEAKSAESFQPTVGAKVPKGIAPQAFPQTLTDEMPILKRFSYLKFKDQILIVDLMTSKIIDMMPQSVG
jgi:hypothetical protein